MQKSNVVPLHPMKAKLKSAAERAFRGHGYSVIKNGLTGKWGAKLVIPLRPVKFERDNFPSRIAAERWIEEIINGLHGESDGPIAS